MSQKATAVCVSFRCASAIFLNKFTIASRRLTSDHFKSKFKPASRRYTYFSLRQKLLIKFNPELWGCGVSGGSLRVPESKRIARMR
jgi:hypothetical protein